VPSSKHASEIKAEGISLMRGAAVMRDPKIAWLVLAGMAMGNVAYAEDEQAVLGIAPNGMIQLNLEKTFQQTIGPEADEQSAEHAQAWALLCDRLTTDGRDMLRQMIYWTSGADTAARAMFPLLAVQRCRLSRETAAEAILPVFEVVYSNGTYEESRRKFLQDPRTDAPFEVFEMLMHYVERPLKVRKRYVADYAPYINALQRRAGADTPIPRGLTLHVYNAIPGEGLMLVASRELGREKALKAFLEPEYVVSEHLWWREW
jgi:hypothetical protein